MDFDVSRKPSILVVEPDALSRENLTNWLERSGYEVTSSPNGFEAIALQRSRPAEVIISELHLPDLHGLDLLSLFREFDPGVQVIIHASDATVDEAIEVLREGRAFDLVWKPLTDPFRLNLAIERALVRRQRTTPPSVTLMTAPNSPKSGAFPENLSKRELEILAYLCKGEEIRVIASNLHLAEKTLRNYLSIVYKKLNVSNRTQAMLFCQKNGLGSAVFALESGS